MANKRNQLRFSAFLLAAPVALGAGCNWTDFDDYPDVAPIRVYTPPGDFGKASYGSVLTTFHGEVQGKTVSRLFASGGAGSPVAITRSWDGKSIGDSALLRCAGKTACTAGTDIGATLIPIGTWGARTRVPRSGCVLAPGNASARPDTLTPGGRTYVLCESILNQQTFPIGLDDVRGVDGTLHFSGVGLPPNHPAGVALLGAYVIDAKDVRQRRLGALYVQPDLGEDEQAPLLQRVPLLDPETEEPFSEADDAGDLGHAIVSATNGGGELLFAISQPSQGRVIIASYEEGAGRTPAESFVTRACISAPEPGLTTFGDLMVAGDVDGDGEPELFIGTHPVPDQLAGEQLLVMYPGRGLPPREAARSSCPEWAEQPVRVDCPDGLGGVRCEGAGFGASLAIGDVDGDQRGDLIVGAPLATVRGMNEAGAAYVIPSGDSGLEGARASLLTTELEPRAHFGASVAALRTSQRDEPVVAAPGLSEMYVFMCTELEEGFGGRDLCLTR